MKGTFIYEIDMHNAF